MKPEEHVLAGLEPDNLLASLALLGLLRAVRHAEPAWQVRAWWAGHPVRPRVRTAVPVTPDQLADAAARGCQSLAEVHDFGAHADLDYSREEARDLLQSASISSHPDDRRAIDLWSALMSDGAVKDDPKDNRVRATPYCLLFGQGHQHFLERLAAVPRGTLPKELAKLKSPPDLNAPEKISEALFSPWDRADATQSFRWDPFEDRRYALRFEDPSTDKALTVHGANRLAALTLPLLTAMPVKQRTEYRLGAIGASAGHRGAITVSWPIWSQPATLDAIIALWATRRPPTYSAERISVGKFFSFTRGLPDDSAIK